MKIEKMELDRSHRHFTQSPGNGAVFPALPQVYQTKVPSRGINLFQLMHRVNIT